MLRILPSGFTACNCGWDSWGIGCATQGTFHVNSILTSTDKLNPKREVASRAFCRTLDLVTFHNSHTLPKYNPHRLASYHKSSTFMDIFFPNSRRRARQTHVVDSSSAVCIPTTNQTLTLESLTAPSCLIKGSAQKLLHFVRLKLVLWRSTKDQCSAQLNSGRHCLAEISMVVRLNEISWSDRPVPLEATHVVSAVLLILRYSFLGLLSRS